MAYKIAPANPPTIMFAWSASQSGQGSPWVTTTDGTNNAIVWVVGAQGDNRLHGYNGDTGAVVYTGGGTYTYSNPYCNAIRDTDSNSDFDPFCYTNSVSHAYTND